MGFGALGLRARPALASLKHLTDDPDERVREAAKDAIILVDKPNSPENLTQDQEQRIASLIEDLLSNDPLRNVTAQARLAKTGRSAVPALLEKLERGDGVIDHFNVLSALAAMGPEAEAAVPCMIRLLATSADYYGAIKVLGAIGPSASAAAPALAELLATPDTAAVCGGEISLALGHIGRSATPFISSIIKSCDVGNDYARTPFVDALQLIVSSDPACLPQLCDALDSPLPNVRCIIARALAELGNLAAPCTVKLVHAASDGTADSRYAAVLALSQSEALGAEHVADLIKLIGDGEVAVRKTAIEILSAMGSTAKPAVPTLVGRSENDHSLRVRRHAAAAAHRILPEQRLPSLATPPVPDWVSLMAELKDQDSPLFKLSVEQRVSLAEDQTDANNEAMRESAWRCVSAGLTHPDSWTRVHFLKIMAGLRVGSDKVLPGVLWALEDEDPWVRKEAAASVSIVAAHLAIDTRRSIAWALVPLLSDEAPLVRLAAVEAVQQLAVQDSQLITPLIERLTDGEMFVRTHSMEIIGFQGAMAVSAVPSVIAVLDDYVRTARPGYAKAPDAEAASVCLQGIGPSASAALPALTRALEVSNVNATRTALSKAIEAIRRK